MPGHWHMPVRNQPGVPWGHAICDTCMTGSQEKGQGYAHQCACRMGLGGAQKQKYAEAIPCRVAHQENASPGGAQKQR